MNKRDKELANQVTWYADVTLTELSRYAALIRSDEREACADIAENWNCNGFPRVGVAAQIRARATK
jgi:hypothetical protein